MPVVDADGVTTLHGRDLEVEIPKGIREGQHLRLAGQGSAGEHGAPPGDPYLEIRFLPHPVFRVDGRDVYVDLPVTPREAALGATVDATTPVGAVRLTVPPVRDGPDGRDRAPAGLPAPALARSASESIRRRPA